MSGTSGTFAFNPTLLDLATDAYERCGLIGEAVTVQNQRVPAVRRSMNLLLSSWSNRGINLWTVQQVVQYMPQGVVQYFDDASCVDILPQSVVLRQYLMNALSNATPAFSTVINTPTVTIAGFNATPIVGGFVSVSVPVSIGGLVIQGFYPVVSVPSSNSCTITAASNAIATAGPAGTVPSFTTTFGSPTVTVTLANHGFVAGSTFNVQVVTNVGGINLSGPYTVATVTSSSVFTITGANSAGSAATVSENNGQTQLATQTVAPNYNQVSSPTDLRLYALSRDDYMAIPMKNQQARPTSFWIDRQVVPTFNIWPAPDANGPYQLVYRRSRQIQDADIAGGQQLQVPYRFLEAFTSELAARLAVKFAPTRAVPLASLAKMEWDLASAEDTEKVSTFIRPDLSGYFV